MNDALSGRRLWLLVRGDFIVGYRSLLAVSGALAGIILVVSIAVQGGIDPGGFSYAACFGWALFIWGLVASSRAFRSMHDKARIEAFLLVPASALEKTLARLLAVTVGLIAYLLVFMTLVSGVVETFNLVLFGDRNPYFNPFDRTVRDQIALYVLLHAPFFLGGAWFRRAHFVKTTLAIALVVAALAALAVFAVRIVFAGNRFDVGDALFLLERSASAHGFGVGAVLLAIALLLTVTFWWLAWLRVREAQVSDGI